MNSDEVVPDVDDRQSGRNSKVDGIAESLEGENGSEDLGNVNVDLDSIEPPKDAEPTSEGNGSIDEEMNNDAENVVKIPNAAGLSLIKSRSNTRSRSKSHPRAHSPTMSRSRSRSPSSSRKKSHSKSRSRSRSASKTRDKSKNKSRRSRSRSRSALRRRRSRSTSSTSRDTYDSFRASSPGRNLGEFQCKKCDRSDFDSVRELSEHQIRAHGASLVCPHCDKDNSSVQKLVDHLRARHAENRLVCEYCKEEFSHKVSSCKDSKWEDYRSHVYRECLREKIRSLERKRPRGSSNGGGLAMRGRGRCPHGPPVRCKNFPKCPGIKCYYSHGYCRYDTKCVKKECPFDHSDRPRICLSCMANSRSDRRSGRR